MDEDGKVYQGSFPAAGKEHGKLQESERKARAILNHTFQFIGLMDTHGTLLEANRTALEFSGITESDVMGKPFWETPWWTHSPELQKKLRSSINKSAKGELVRFEATHPAADGSLRYIDFSLKPVMDESGKIVYLIPEGRDITDRKIIEEELKKHRDHLETLVKERTAELTKANDHLKQEIVERKRVERALLESEESYNTHFSLTSDVMYVLDSQFKVMSVSPNVENALGYKSEELIGRPFQELGVLEPDCLEKAAADTMHVLDGKMISSSVYRFITKDGRRIYGEVSGVPLMRHGRIEGVISVARDITRRMLAENDLKRHRDHLEELVSERTAELTSLNEQLSREILKQKQTEGSLEDRQAKLDSIIRTAPIGIGIVADRVMLEVNEHLCNMTGYSREELIGKSSRMIYVTQKEFEFVGIDKSRQIKERGVGYMETRWKRKDGSILDILLSSTTLVPGDFSSGVMFTALDITDRKCSEKQLLESQKMLRLVLDTIPIRVFWKDLDLNYLGCNRRFAQEAGLADADAIVGMNDFAMSWAGHAELYRSYDCAVIDTGLPKLNYEHLEKRSDGSSAWLRSSKIPLQDIDGKTKGILGISEDITKQKLAEKELGQSQEYFRAITENLPGVVFQFFARKNGENGLYYVSDRSAEILGLDNNPKDFFELIVSRCAPEDKEALLTSIDEAVRLVSRWEFETSYVKPTGEKLFIRGISLPTEYDDEIIFSGVLLDVTEQRLAEKAIRTANKQLENIIEFLPDATCIIDEEKRIIAWNRAMEEMTDVPKMDVIGKDHYYCTVPFYGEPRPYLMDLLDKDDEEITAKYTFFKRKGDSVFCEVFAPALNNGNGAHIWAVASPLYDGDGTVIGAIESIRDITDHKRAEDELKRHRDKLEEMVRERTSDLIKTYEQLKQENETRKTTENLLRSREMELEQNQLSLKETNIALRILLQKREEDKATLEETIMTNIKTAVFPFIEKLKNSGLREGQNAYLSEIELHLREIASTYIKKLSSDHISLSPCEIQVASLIKEGKSSKDIAELLNVSLNTVLSHRFCIRKKTGLKGKKINLESYLQTLT